MEIASPRRMSGAWRDGMSAREKRSANDVRKPMSFICRSIVPESGLRVIVFFCRTLFHEICRRGQKHEQGCYGGENAVLAPCPNDESLEIHKIQRRQNSERGNPHEQNRRAPRWSTQEPPRESSGNEIKKESENGEGDAEDP